MWSMPRKFHSGEYCMTQRQVCVTTDHNIKYDIVLHVERVALNSTCGRTCGLSCGYNDAF